MMARCSTLHTFPSAKCLKHSPVLQNSVKKRHQVYQLASFAGNSMSEARGWSAKILCNSVPHSMKGCHSALGSWIDYCTWDMNEGLIAEWSCYILLPHPFPQNAISSQRHRCASPSLVLPGHHLQAECHAKVPWFPCALKCAAPCLENCESALCKRNGMMI